MPDSDHEGEPEYFPLLESNGKLSNQFLVVSNISPSDASAVITGNERVVRPRLADAKFFFDQDRKHKLETRLEKLRNVVYHNKLGSGCSAWNACRNWPAKLPSACTPIRPGTTRRVSGESRSGHRHGR